tara:strand:- start:1701 stop:2537 length:837 start_codon:yes stop_codon:yes gene_type:complete
MSSKVNYGKYRVNTDGLIFRADGYCSRSYDHNTEYWRDLSPSGLDVKLTDSGLYDEASGYYKFRNPDNGVNTYAAISGANFTGLRSLGVLKDENSSFTLEAFFEIKDSGANNSPPDDGAVIFGNTDHNKSGYSYGFVAHTGNGGEISGINAVMSTNKVDGGANHPWTGMSVTLSDVNNPSISGSDFRHVAMTYDSSTSQMVGYMDGLVKGTGSFPVDNPSGFHTGVEDQNYHQLYIGGNISSGLNINIGMVSAYNRALSSGEVFGNCKAVKHRYGQGY